MIKPTPPASAVDIAMDEWRRHHQDLNTVNEQLRQVVESLKAHREHHGESDKLAEDVARPSEEEMRLRGRLEEIERENLRLLERFAAVEEQTFRLTSLFVTLHQLHQSTERADVLATLQEIVVNLLGSEQLAVFEVNGRWLRLLHSAGIDREVWREVPVGEGCIGRVVSEGIPQFAPTLFRGATVTACIPLRAGRRIVGALAIFELLSHKALLGPFDLELLEALSVHAGAALCLAGYERCGKA